MQTITQPNLHNTFTWFESHLDDSDYLVGWIDAFATGRRLGRSELHRAIHVLPEEDPLPQRTLRLSHQQLPENLMRIILDPSCGGFKSR